ncbi:hypothetical protein [Desulfosarcina ovata]|uniref:hypothetical protein n=1 Tax=Desulfosarcina ovata TaxID=83564 RepID=UPI0012D2D085|nr:hypothetical protein [Desulfosarcina ovata]
MQLDEQNMYHRLDIHPAQPRIDPAEQQDIGHLGVASFELRNQYYTTNCISDNILEPVFHSVDFRVKSGDFGNAGLIPPYGACVYLLNAFELVFLAQP